MQSKLGGRVFVSMQRRYLSISMLNLVTRWLEEYYAKQRELIMLIFLRVEATYPAVEWSKENAVPVFTGFLRKVFMDSNYELE